MIDKLKEVFSKEYTSETEYRAFFDREIDAFKLKIKNEYIDDKIDRLKGINYQSNFSLDLD